MARDGSGNYALPLSSVVAGTTIQSSWANTTLDDVAAAMTSSIAKDGQTNPTANLPMNGKKHTGAADATLATDYLTAGQSVNGGDEFFVAGGSANAVTGTMPLGGAAYVTGQRFTFVAANTNTASTTLNLSGIGAKTIKKEGTTNLGAGDITSGEVVDVLYDGTNFQKVNTPPYTSTDAISAIGISFTSGDRIVWSGTLMSGWTRDSGDNQAIQIVNNVTPGADGGTVSFLTAFQSKAVSGSNTATGLTVAQMPSHAHGGGTIPSANGIGSNGFAVRGASESGTISVTEVSQGSGSTHNHSFSGNAINLSVKYTQMNVITKT